MYNKRNYRGENEMKVFISWSGDKSFKVAETLREWIPCIIQGIDPYFSSADIDKGTRWSSDIAKELEAADFGILCVTKENLDSSWLNFEAGALSKAIDKAKVCPFLFDLKPSDISNSPILQFQMTNVDRDDIYKLFQSMNSCMGDNGLTEERLKKMFELSWPKIDEALKLIETATPGKVGKKTENNHAILEEMLDLLRSQQILLRSPSQLLPEDYLNSIVNKSNDSIERTIKNFIPEELLDEQQYYEIKLLHYIQKMRSEYKESCEMYLEFLRLIDRYITNNRRIFSFLGIKNIPRSVSRKRAIDVENE